MTPEQPRGMGHEGFSNASLGSWALLGAELEAAFGGFPGLEWTL